MTTVVAIVLSVGLGTHAQPTQSPTPGSIQGTVLGENGRPLVGATVYAYADLNYGKQFRVTSDARGIFVLSGLPAGLIYVDAFKESDGYPYNFFAFKKAIGEESHRVDIVAGAQIHNYVIKLGPKAATLHVDVTQPDGTPVAGLQGLEFTRDDRPGFFAEGMKADHTVLVPSLAPFRFSVKIPGYKPWTSQLLTTRPGETLDITVRLERQ